MYHPVLQTIARGDVTQEFPGNMYLVIRLKGELCASCNTQSRYNYWSLGSKEFKNSPATFRQRSLAVPSLAPDKTARLLHNRRPPDGVRRSHLSRRWKENDSDVTNLAIAHLSSLCFQPRHLGSCACLWVHVFFFLILEPSACPCDKYIAQASLWLPSDLCTWWTWLAKSSGSVRLMGLTCYLRSEWKCFNFWNS